MTINGTTSEFTATIASYEPTHVRRVTWSVIQEPIRKVVLSTTNSEASARKVLPVLASFGSWLHSEGITPNNETLGSPDLIERYSQVGMPGALDSTRATRRAILRRVADRLTSEARPPRPEAIAYRRAKAPYRPWEVRGFFDQAAAQPTVARRAALQGLLALGLGCGLDHTDLAWVRGIDVAVGDHAVVTVIGGARPRAVIALDAYRDIVKSCACVAGENLLIGGSKLGRHNVTTPALDRMVHDSRLPRLTASRLRSTWLVRHLELGTPLSVLLPAAGLASSRTLDDLLEYATPIPTERGARLLRGEST